MEEVLNRSEQDFAGTNAKIQMALLYVSGFRDQDATLRTALQLLRRKYRLIEHIVATVAHGIIGNEGSTPTEVEQAPAVSLTLASMEGADVTSFTVTGERLPDADASPLEWEGLTGVPLDTNDNVSFILFGSPTFARIDDLLRGLDFAYPEAAKIGGLVSGPPQQGAGTAESPSGWVIAVERCSRKAQDAPAEEASTSGRDDTSSDSSPGAQVERQMVWGGCAAMVIRGKVLMEPLIAQGCRPLTEEVYSIEKVVEKGVVLELATTSRKFPKSFRPMEALGQDLATHGGRKYEGELQRMARNLTVAVAPDDFKPANELEPADFLVRSLIGFDQATGAMAIGEGVRVGQRLRFMVRDRDGAMQDLNNHALSIKRRQLQASLEARQQPPPFGALIFTCNGRGQNLYQEDNYDSRTLASFVPVPFSGMFCNGEIGQVGKSTYLHGFTAAVGILRESIEVEEQPQPPKQREQPETPPEGQQ